MDTHRLIQCLEYPILVCLTAILAACGSKPVSGPQAMPTPTPTISPAIPSYTPTPTYTHSVTHTLAPTNTAQSLAPTLTPTATTTPAPTSTPAAETTPAPTFTVTEVPTPTPTPLPTLIEVPTPVLESVTPTLLAPFAGTVQGIPITFRWDGPVNAGEAFQITVQYTESGKRIQTSPMTEREWTVDLPKDLVGEWKWAVWLVKDGQLLRISDEWHFYFDPHKGPGPRPTPEPTNTPPTKAVGTPTRIQPTYTALPTYTATSTNTPRAR